WIQHLFCDLPRLVINCTILAQVAHQQSLKDRGEAPTLNLPELGGITHAAIALNIMLQVCHLIQFLGALVVMVLVRMGKLVSLRKDEHLHTYCQRNLNVRVVRLYKLTKSSGTAPLREHNHLQQQMDQYNSEENGIDLSLAALAWDTETQDDHIDYNHYAYRPRPTSNGPPSRGRRPTMEDGGRVGGHERIEMTETIPHPQSASSVSPPILPLPTPQPGSFSYAQMQHLQLQKQKYGDNRDLYETMEWTPSAPNSAGQYQQPPHHSGQQFQGYGHEQEEYTPLTSGDGNIGAQQWAPQSGRTPPPIPPKNFR
ncbi:hypothetical protein BGZ98_009127, partial [Dissophora globulifera]